MRRASFAGFILPALVMTLLAAPAASAQDPSAVQVLRDQVVAYAKVELAITKARDGIQAELAQTRNKTPEAQKHLQEKLRTQIEEILHHSGMSETEYQRQTYLISTEPERRKMFDDVVAELTGAPTIAQLQAQSAAATTAAAARGGGRGGRGGRGGEGGGEQVALPPGPVGTHLGHVLNAFGDTPNGQGLLPTAMAEARTAAQHAGLASRAATNLNQMKTHAGHIMHAVDPSAMEAGPGQGYGVKKAATAVANHVELAARAEGAAPAITTHATHIATSARNTAKRADEIVALCKQVQAAPDAAAAAALVSQIVSLADQLIAGGDANGDGRVGWQEGEGGLQQAEEHLTLMLRAENK